MRRIVHILLLLLLCFIFVSSPVGQSFAADKSLRIAVYPLEPHMIMAENEQDFRGAAIQAIRKICAELNIRLELVNLPFARALLSLDNKSVDGILLLAKNKEREQKYLFLDNSFLIDRSVFVVMADSPISELKSPRDLSGKRVAHVKGSIIPDYLQDSGIDWDFSSGEEYFKINVEKLRHKRVEALFVPTLSHGKWKFKAEYSKVKVRFLPIKESKIELFLAMRKDIDPNLAKSVNALIKKYM